MYLMTSIPWVKSNFLGPRKSWNSLRAQAERLPLLTSFHTAAKQPDEKTISKLYMIKPLSFFRMKETMEKKSWNEWKQCFPMSHIHKQLQHIVTDPNNALLSSCLSSLIGFSKLWHRMWSHYSIQSLFAQASKTLIFSS